MDHRKLWPVTNSLGSVESVGTFTMKDKLPKVSKLTSRFDTIRIKSKDINNGFFLVKFDLEADIMSYRIMNLLFIGL